MRVAGQTREELCNLCFSHLRWMSFIMKEDESLDPSDVGFLRHVTVMARADRLPNLIEELGFADDGALAIGAGWLAKIRSRFGRNTLLVSMMSPLVADAVRSSMFNATYDCYYP